MFVIFDRFNDIAASLFNITVATKYVVELGGKEVLFETAEACISSVCPCHLARCPARDHST